MQVVSNHMFQSKVIASYSIGIKERLLRYRRGRAPLVVSDHPVASVLVTSLNMHDRSRLEEMNFCVALLAATKMSIIIGLTTTARGRVL